MNILDPFTMYFVAFRRCWKFPQNINRGVLKVVSRDVKLTGQQPQENSNPEITKQTGRARKLLGGCID